MLKLPAMFQIDLQSLCTRDIVQVCIRTSRSNNPTKRLARVKKEMDEPRMTEFTREEDVNQDHAAGVRKAAVVEGENESGAAQAQGAPEGEK